LGEVGPGNPGPGRPFLNLPRRYALGQRVVGPSAHLLPEIIIASQQPP
jgi:hypothetical protein